MNAQRMAREGLWRIREMPDDNAPIGREMHWSQFLLWWLVLLGWLGTFFTSLPLGASIEAAAVWCVVPLHLLLAIGLPISLRKVFGSPACALLAFGIGGFYCTASLFFAGECDHHGLVTSFLLCSLLFFCAYFWDSRSKLGWMVASGVFLGAGLWISTATVIPALTGWVLAFGMFLLLPSGRLLNLQGIPAWSLSAAISSLCFYLLEYFPSHMACRLEVNNPVYSLAVLGVGSFLYFLRPSAPIRTSALRIVVLGASAVAIALPFFLIAVFRKSVFAPSDAFLYHLHHDYIAEFQNITAFLKKQTWDQAIACLSLLPLLVFAMVRLFFTDEVSSKKKAAISCVIGAAGVFTVLACLQVRWLGTANTLWLAALTMVVASVFPGANGKPVFLNKIEWVLLAVFLCAIMIPMPQIMLREAWCNRGREVVPSEGDIAVAFARDTAYRLRALSGKTPAVVASGPTTTTWLMYFGGLKGLGTLYWENAEGLKTCAALYAAPSPAEAAKLIKERNISFLVFLSPEPCDNEYPRLYRHLPPGPPLEDSFAVGLTNLGQVPAWAKTIEMSVPENLANAWAEVYDVRQAGKSLPATSN